MLTKIEAARIAANAGVRTVITDGQHPENLPKILDGADLGTQFSPQQTVANARKRWIAQSLIPAGKLYLDNGAVKAIQTGGKSLLPAGITEIEGEFDQRSAVQLCDAQGHEIARGIVNYSHTELAQIIGHQSEEISQILGYAGVDTVVHRDNLVISHPK
jgi:glutamate 5-kinase